MSRRLLAVIAALVAAAWLPAMARADGDPASDVLATQTLFLPQDAAVPSARHEQLLSLLAAARTAGVPLRVAIVSSPADLGSVTELWRRPELYARFLGQELSLVFRGPVLVVMPDGFGLYPQGRLQSALATLPRPGSGAALGAAALAALERIAAASGHPLRTPAAGGEPASGPRAGGATAWIVFAGGAALIVIAWALSLRARPLQLTSRYERT